MVSRVGFLVFPGFNLLDLSGPLCVFETANNQLTEEMRYQLDVCAAQAGTVTSSNGVTLEVTSAAGKRFDTLIVVGGSGVGEASRDPALLLLLNSNTASRYVSVCTGAFVLAAAGKLTGKRATTHWGRAAELKRLVPDIRLQPDDIVVEDGDVWTSAGATAGMDIALALVEAQHGRALTHLVTRILLIPHRRTRGQMHFMDMRAMTPPPPRIQRILDYISRHLQADLSVTALAEQAFLSPRQLSREFIAHTGLSPARAVELMRVEYARSRLENSNQPLSAIAAEAGFSDTAIMRKAFLRCLNATPRQLRQGAGAAAAPEEAEIAAGGE